MNQFNTYPFPNLKPLPQGHAPLKLYQYIHRNKTEKIITCCKCKTCWRLLKHNCPWRNFSCCCYKHYCYYKWPSSMKSNNYWMLQKEFLKKTIIILCILCLSFRVLLLLCRCYLPLHQQKKKKVSAGDKIGITKTQSIPKFQLSKSGIEEEKLNAPKTCFYAR